MSAHLSELPQSVAAVPRGAGCVLGLVWSLTGIRSFSPRCLELLPFFHLLPLFPFLRAKQVWPWLFIACLPAANPSCSLTAVHKLNVSNLLSCSVASEDTFSFSQTFSETTRKAASHYLRVTVRMRL